MFGRFRSRSNTIITLSKFCSNANSNISKNGIETAANSVKFEVSIVDDNSSIPLEPTVKNESLDKNIDMDYSRHLKTDEALERLRRITRLEDKPKPALDDPTFSDESLLQLRQKARKLMENNVHVRLSHKQLQIALTFAIIAITIPITFL